MSPDGASSPRPYHHGALREAALEVGRALLAEVSVEAVSLREIARRIGVSAPSVYRHFPDKAALLKAIAAQGLEALAEAQRTASRAAGGGRRGYLAMGEAYIAFAVQNPALFRLIFGHVRTDNAGAVEVSGSMRMLMTAAEEIVQPGTESGAFALHSWAVVHGIAMLVLDGQIAYEPIAIRAALRATGARPSSR